MSHGFWLYANETPNWAKEYVFKSSFEAKKGATMTANISADTRYRLYINGNFVCDGPVKGTQYDWAYEQPVLTPYLKEGKNDITVRVLYCPAGTSIALNTFRKGHVALWFDGTIVEDGVERKFVSDNNFTCERVDSINYIPTSDFLHLCLHLRVIWASIRLPRSVAIIKQVYRLTVTPFTV